MSLKEILSATYLHELNPTRPVVTLNKDDTLAEALLTLAREKLHSVPVRDDDKHTWTEFVSAHHILSHVLSLVYPAEPPAAEEQIDLHKLLGELDNLRKQSHVFTQKKISDVMGHSEPIIPVSIKATLWETLPPFASGLPRIAAFDRNGDLVVVVSQSAVLDFVAKNISGLDLSIGSTTLRGAGLIKKREERSPILKIDQDTPAMDAFWKMFSSHTDSAAIVDKSGKLVSHLAESDISGITDNNFAHLLLPTSEFIGKYSRRGGLLPPVMARSRVTIETVILKMYACRVRRIWIVSKHQHPKAIISLSDIFKFLVESIK